MSVVGFGTRIGNAVTAWGAMAGSALRRSLGVERCLLCRRLLGDDGPSLCRRCIAALPHVRGTVCGRCGVPLVSEEGLCLRCRTAEYGFDSVRAALLYRDVGAEIVRLYKLHDHPSLSRVLAAAAAPLLAVHPPSIPLVPVPARPERLRTFGWDQVDLLVQALRSIDNRNVLPVLRRTDGQSQKTLNLRGRQENLVGRIHCAADGIPETCLLVDDVMTTGATLSVCASALKGAGARIVHCVVIAVD